VKVCRSIEQDHGLARSFDATVLMELCRPALERGEAVDEEVAIRNVHRTAGGMLAGEVVRRYGPKGLPDGTIRLRFSGSAGQSFGAFTAPGTELHLAGDANDYVGKGMAGGLISVRPPEGATFRADENIIIGNTALYGATGGKVFFSGVAGERFAVRNSGAQAVVEGVGDHGCEYMTGGVVVVLGSTGRNFAAGMSGGMAFVLDRERSFRKRCNLEMVELESLVDESEDWLVHGMIERHFQHTESTLARRVLDNWELMVPQFVKVMPTDYKRVLQARRAARKTPTLVPQRRVAGGEG
jgi:glutamate synthase (NADPH/NADH) large chain